MTTNGSVKGKKPTVRKLSIPPVPHRLLSFSTSEPITPDERRDPVWLEIDGERFQCTPTPPVGVLQDLRSTMTAEDIIGAEVDFICSVMVSEDDATRFRSLLRRRDSPVSARLLDAIWTRLLEEYTGAPLVPPSDSTPGSETETIPSLSVEASFAAAPLPSPASPSGSDSQLPTP